VSYGIRRYEFDDYLLRRSGATLRLDESANTFERRQERWIVNGKFEAPLLVGAGGHFCPVARTLGARQSAAAVVYAQEAEYEADPRASGNVAGEAPALYFCDDLLGYGWVFRKGNFLNVGLGRADASELSSHVQRFCDFLWDSQIVQGPRPAKWLGHAYQLYRQVTPVLAGDGALLVGDAAGLAYAQSGEGIRPAIESGLLAAQQILAAAGDYSQDRLAPYATNLMARLGKPATGNLTWLPQAWLHWTARRLLAQRWFCRQVVMDKWFLHAKEAALEV
jgi:flavin-dependent dehydrogenase